MDSDHVQRLDARVRTLRNVSSELETSTISTAPLAGRHPPSGIHHRAEPQFVNVLFNAEQGCASPHAELYDAPIEGARAIAPPAPE